MSKRIPTRQLIDGLLKGERRALARAISRVEDEADDAAQIVQAAFAHTGKAHPDGKGRAAVIGITGAPGTGKSTLVSVLAESYPRARANRRRAGGGPDQPFQRRRAAGGPRAHDGAQR